MVQMVRCYAKIEQLITNRSFYSLLKEICSHDDILILKFRLFI